MAYPSKILLAVLVFIATASLGRAFVFDGKPIAEVRVRGQLFCSATGNRIPIISSPPLVGVNVSILCSGQTVAQVSTNATGSFEAVLTSQQAQINLFGISNCFATVRLPVANCAQLSRTGVLRAPLSSVNVLQSALGNILNVNILSFEPSF